jgi:hypothetical protein
MRALMTALPGAGWRVVIAVLLFCGQIPAAPAAPPGFGASGALVQLIAADTRDDHTNILVQFSCSVHYLSNSPASHGSSTRITLRLGPDCGALLGGVVPEFPPISGGEDLLTSARLESVLPGEVFLELDWSRDMDFVMAPTADATGLRVRLFNIEPQRKGHAYVLENSPSESYSVNLDSSLQPYARADIEGAAAKFSTQAFVSEIEINGEHWYRLRLGPYASRAEAERVLNSALSGYPRAWVAVNDEAGDIALAERADVPPAPRVTDPPLSNEERAKILSEARAALDKHQYPEAVDRLSTLTRQPEYPGRAEAQELLGLARERSGQLAQAKAEYQAYLQSYPQGAGADRVRQRLQALAVASITPRTFEGGASPARGFSLVGSASLGYQYDKGQTVSGGTTTSSSTVESALVYGDLLMRDRGSRYDFTGRFDAGYIHNSASTPGGSQDRTTLAYAELTDRSWGLSGRVGRQTLLSQGIVGLFDGVLLGYQINPHFSVSVAGGSPAYSSYSEFSLHQQFETVSVEYAPILSLVFDAYVFHETEQGITDRRSIGLQTRFSRPGYTALAIIDYDVYFQQLNSATMVGNFKVGEHWLVGVNLDHRHSPLLEANDALIGQPYLDLRSLQSVYSESQIKQLAIDRSPYNDTLVLSVSRPLGERWQIMTDIAALRLGATPASGGVPATPSTGVDKSADLQLAGSSLLAASDLHIFAVRFDDSPTTRSITLSWDARFPVGGAWRLGPRFGIARLESPDFGGPQTLYLPEARADWTGRRQIFELIAGYQLQQQTVQQQLQNDTGALQATSLEQRNLYFSATYRLRF